jgi:MFS family permease
MMPLDLFGSSTFSGVNLLTLLLYGALGGAFFFVPFLLIQVHGYSATATGAAFLPFALILGILSRRAGALADRVGARIPLIIGPAIVALGFVLLAMATPSPHYWALLAPMTVLGVGMAVTVAPLTTTVVNAVPARQTGVASGINNAVASVASLLMIAVLGTVALGALNQSLDTRLENTRSSSDVKVVVDQARGGFVIPTMPRHFAASQRKLANEIITDSFVDSIRLVMLIAAALSLAAALSAAFTIRKKAN